MWAARRHAWQAAAGPDHHPRRLARTHTFIPTPRVPLRQLCPPHHTPLPHTLHTFIPQCRDLQPSLTDRFNASTAWNHSCSPAHLPPPLLPRHTPLPTTTPRYLPHTTTHSYMLPVPCLSHLLGTGWRPPHYTRFPTPTPPPPPRTTHDTTTCGHTPTTHAPHTLPRCACHLPPPPTTAPAYHWHALPYRAGTLPHGCLRAYGPLFGWMPFLLRDLRWFLGLPFNSFFNRL